MKTNSNTNADATATTTRRQSNGEQLQPTVSPATEERPATALPARGMELAATEILTAAVAASQTIITPTPTPPTQPPPVTLVPFFPSPYPSFHLLTPYGPGMEGGGMLMLPNPPPAHLSTAPLPSSVDTAQPPSLPPPTRPRGAYLHFFSAHQAKIQAAFPELVSQEMTPYSKKKGGKNKPTNSTGEMNELEKEEKKTNAAGATTTTTPSTTIAANDSSSAPPKNSHFAEVSRLLGWEWRQLTPQQKEPYEALAQADSKRYQLECEAQEQTRTGKAAKSTPPRGGTTPKKKRSHPIDSNTISINSAASSVTQSPPSTLTLTVGSASPSLESNKKPRLQDSVS